MPCQKITSFRNILSLFWWSYHFSNRSIHCSLICYNSRKEKVITWQQNMYVTLVLLYTKNKKPSKVFVLSLWCLKMAIKMLTWHHQEGNLSNNPKLYNCRENGYIIPPCYPKASSYHFCTLFVWNNSYRWL